MVVYHTQTDIDLVKQELIRCDRETQKLLQPLLSILPVQTMLISFVRDTSKSFQDWIFDPYTQSVLWKLYATVVDDNNDHNKQSQSQSQSLQQMSGTADQPSLSCIDQKEKEMEIENSSTSSSDNTMINNNNYNDNKESSSSGKESNSKNMINDTVSNNNEVISVQKKDNDKDNKNKKNKKNMMNTNKFNQEFLYNKLPDLFDQTITFRKDNPEVGNQPRTIRNINEAVHLLHMAQQEKDIAKAKYVAKECISATTLYKKIANSLQRVVFIDNNATFLSTNEVEEEEEEEQEEQQQQDTTTTTTSIVNNERKNDFELQALEQRRVKMIVDCLCNAAIACFQSKDYTETYEICTKALVVSHQKCVKALYWRGKVLINQKLYESALLDLEKAYAMESNDQKLEVLYKRVRAKCKIIREEKEEYEERLKRQIKRRPRNPKKKREYETDSESSDSDSDSDSDNDNENENDNDIKDKKKGKKKKEKEDKEYIDDYLDLQMDVPKADKDLNAVYPEPSRSQKMIRSSFVSEEEQQARILDTTVKSWMLPKPQYDKMMCHTPLYMFHNYIDKCEGLPKTARSWTAEVKKEGYKKFYRYYIQFPPFFEVYGEDSTMKKAKHVAAIEFFRKLYPLYLVQNPEFSTEPGVSAEPKWLRQEELELNYIREKRRLADLAAEKEELKLQAEEEALQILAEEGNFEVVDFDPTTINPGIVAKTLAKLASFIGDRSENDNNNDNNNDNDNSKKNDNNNDNNTATTTAITNKEPEAVDRDVTEAFETYVRYWLTEIKKHETRLSVFPKYLNNKERDFIHRHVASIGNGFHSFSVGKGKIRRAFVFYDKDEPPENTEEGISIYAIINENKKMASMFKDWEEDPEVLHVPVLDGFENEEELVEFEEEERLRKIEEAKAEAKANRIPKKRGFEHPSQEEFHSYVSHWYSEIRNKQIRESIFPRGMNYRERKYIIRYSVLKAGKGFHAFEVGKDRKSIFVFFDKDEPELWFGPRDTSKMSQFDIQEEIRQNAKWSSHFRNWSDYPDMLYIPALDGMWFDGKIKKKADKKIEKHMQDWFNIADKTFEKYIQHWFNYIKEKKINQSVFPTGLDNKQREQIHHYAVLEAGGGFKTFSVGKKSTRRVFVLYDKDQEPRDDLGDTDIHIIIRENGKLATNFQKWESNPNVLRIPEM